MNNDDTPDLDAELAALNAANEAEHEWRTHPEQMELDGVHAFVLYHLNATTNDDFAGEFGVSVGVTGPSPGEGIGPSQLAFVALGVEASTGRRLTNVLFDVTEARQLAGQLLTASDEAEKHNAIHKPTPEELQEHFAQVLSRITVRKLAAASRLSEDEVRECLDRLNDDTH